MALSLSVTNPATGAVATYHVVLEAVLDNVNNNVTVTVGHYAGPAQYQASPADSLWADTTSFPIQSTQNVAQVVGVLQAVLAGAGALAGASVAA